MNIQQLSSRIRSPRGFLLGLLTFLLLLTLSACGGGGNNSVQIYDNAHVLNSSKVQNAASDLSNPIAIYTTNTFQGTQADFQRTTVQKLKGNSNMIVMAIDTNSRYIYIARGANVSLSSTGINQAVNAFAGSFNNGDYTNASVAALGSMQNSLGASSQNRGGPAFSPLIPCLLLPLLLILGIAFFAMNRRRRMGGIMNRGNAWSPSPNQGPYNDPNQGYGPYNQGYGAPNQRGGMNPWAAGGLGAAAGGLAGYELGKMSGEREGERNDFDTSGGGNFGGNDPNGNGGDAGGGGFFGGGGDAGGGNFGGGDAGGGGFFGGGGGDNSGGGNF